MDDLELELANFTGTEHYYQHNVGNFQYTDGIKYLAEKGRCYWLLDVIGSYQLLKEIKPIPFQLWELTVHENDSAVVTMKEDTDQPLLVNQKIPFTDFPLKHTKLYLDNGVLMLPTEY